VSPYRSELVWFKVSCPYVVLVEERDVGLVEQLSRLEIPGSSG